MATSLVDGVRRPQDAASGLQWIQNYVDLVDDRDAVAFQHFEDRRRDLGLRSQTAKFGFALRSLGGSGDFSFEF